MERLIHQRVHMGHQFYLSKRKMVPFECISIIELSTLKQFRIVMLYLELTNYSIVYMEQKSIRKSISQVDIIKLGSILKTDIKQLFERDMDIMNSMLCHLIYLMLLLLFRI